VISVLAVDGRRAARLRVTPAPADEPETAVAAEPGTARG
jgi:hypothetical protein